MSQEELSEIVDKPDSLLSERVKQVLLEAIRREEEKALEIGDDEYLVELQKAKKLVNKGCWTIRRDNPYLHFMRQCLIGQGGTLEDTQEAMRRCAEKWRNLTEEERERYRAEAKGKVIYDYL